LIINAPDVEKPAAEYPAMKISVQLLIVIIAMD